MDTYVIGHKNPDTDSVASAIAAAKLMGHKPAVFGAVNRETAFVLEKLGIPAPEALASIAGKKVFLVDHNENTQMADGWETAEIIGVLDHHKINFSSAAPVFFHAETLGSTSTIIAKTYMELIKRDAKIAGLLLAGILSDTVIFKSPTTAEEDKTIAGELAKIAGIEDAVKFGVEIKTAGADIAGRSVGDIVHADFKDFDMNGKKVGVGQIELPDITVLKNMEPEIVACLAEKKGEGYELAMLAVTDIMAEGSKLLFAGDPEVIKKAFGVTPEGSGAYVPGLISRKKQIIPPLEGIYRQ